MTLSSSQACRGRMSSIKPSRLIPAFLFILSAYMLFGRLALLEDIAAKPGTEVVNLDAGYVAALLSTPAKK